MTGSHILNGAVAQYSPSPTEMIASLTGGEVINRSVNGITLAELLRGGVVAQGVPAGVTVQPLAVQLLSDPSPEIIIGAGMNDALFTDISLAEYLTLVREAAATVNAAGKRPIMRGFHRLLESETLTAKRLARLAEFDAALQGESARMWVMYLNTRDAEPEMAADLLHPTPAFHQRIAALIASQLNSQ